MPRVVSLSAELKTPRLLTQGAALSQPARNERYSKSNVPTFGAERGF